MNICSSIQEKIFDDGFCMLLRSLWRSWLVWRCFLTVCYPSRLDRAWFLAIVVTWSTLTTTIHPPTNKLFYLCKSIYNAWNTSGVCQLVSVHCLVPWSPWSPGTQVGYLSLQWSKWAGGKNLRKNLVFWWTFVFWSISLDMITMVGTGQCPNSIVICPNSKGSLQKKKNKKCGNFPHFFYPPPIVWKI